MARGRRLALTVVLGLVVAAPAQAAQLLGTSQVLGSADYNPAGVAEAFRTTASASGTVSSLSVYVDAGSSAPTLVAGLYAETAGHPGALLAQGTLSAPTAGSWNTVTLSGGAAVTAGTAYWIAILGPSGTFRYRDACCGGGTAAETHSTRTLTALPGAWSTGSVHADGPVSAYGSSADGPVLSVTPGTLAFAASEGGGAPPGQTISVANAGGGLLDWSAATSAGWLTVFPASGVGPATPSVSVSPAGLVAGTYSGTVTVTAPGAQASPSLVTVTLTVTRVDGSPPTVSISDPSDGASVSGTVVVSATAADDVGVVGVQFRLDGAALGTEDVAAPYSVSWATGGVANGSHVLTAVARDASGKATTSAAVTVTVENTAPPAPVGLVAAYGFEEASGTTVSDASGNGNVGTISGPTRSTAGKNGSALSFDGSNDWVTIPDAPSLDLTAAMTLEAWVYPTALGSTWRTTILKESPGYFTYALYANTNGGRPAGHVYTTADLDARGSSGIPLNAWTHLATTWDGATLTLYVNGVQAASRAVSGTMAASSGPLRIGGNSVWNEWFRGRIDDVRVYAKALTAADVQADMQTGVGGTPPPPPAADTTPPTVSVTAPAAGATVSGATTMSASAADNVGVAGVQFRVDGLNLGAEDTSAPYTLSWDTTGAANGGHSITAVARDATGNTTTSAAVPVTVANSGGGGLPEDVGQWSPPVDWPLVAVHMSLLPTGNVIAFDGFDAAVNSERIWNPTAGTFTPVPYGRNLFCAGHVLLADGRTLVVGGHIAAYEGLADTTLYNATTSTWTRAPDMAAARWYPTATVLGDGRVFVLAGDSIVQDRPGATPPFSDASVNSLPEVYDPASNAWTDLTGARITSPLYPQLFVLSDGRLIDVGPDTTTRTITPGTWAWSVVGSSPFDGHSSVMYRPDKIMKAGSWADPDFKGSLAYTAHGRTAVLDMTQASPAWRETAPMAAGRSYHNLTLLPDGTVLASGGQSNSDGVDITKAVLPAEIWNPDTETWRTVAPLRNGREYHSTALLLPDGRVLMAGGGQLPGSIAVDQRNAEIYSPPYLFKGARPTISAAPDTISYGRSFTVSTPDAARIAKVSLIRTPSVTHAFDQNQRFQWLSFAQSGGGLTVQAPATSNLAPPGYYMLFLVDTNGVPSVASFVRFPAPWEDTSPPTAPATLTAAGGVGSVSLSWSAAGDDVGVTRYSVYRSATAGFTPSLANRIAQPTGTSYTDSGRPAGTWYYRVRAEDAAGNLGPSSPEASAVVTGDVQPPSVSVTSPAAASTVSGSIALTASASDDVGVAGVQFRVDGAAQGAEDVTVPYSVSWDTTGVANGAHTVTAVARDAAGNTWTSTAVNVTVSNTAPPPLRLLAGSTSIEPVTDYNAAGTAEAFEVTAAASGSLAQVSLYVDATSAASSVVVGVYADSGGRPGSLLATATLPFPTVSAWNDVPVSATPIAAGTRYWIAAMSPLGAGVLRFRDRCCGGGASKAETSFASDLSTFPAGWTTGSVYSDGPISASLWGT